MRPELRLEALRLGRTLAELVRSGPEPPGLVSLMHRRLALQLRNTRGAGSACLCTDVASGVLSLFGSVFYRLSHPFPNRIARLRSPPAVPPNSGVTVPVTGSYHATSKVVGAPDL